LCISLVLGCVLACVAQDIPQAEEEAPHILFEEKLGGLWNDYLQAKYTGDATAQAKAFVDIENLKGLSSGDIFEKAAYLFLEEGFRDLAQDRYDAARREFLNAAALNQYLWPAYSGLARVKLERKEPFKQYLTLHFKGFRSAFRMNNAFFILDALVWFLENILWVLMISFISFVVLLCVKYIRPAYYTSVGMFEEFGLAHLFAHLLAITLFLLPFLLGVNVFLVTALYIVLFIPFFELRERYAAYLLFLVPVAIPFLSMLLGNINNARSNPLLRAHLSQYFDGEPDSLIHYLQTNQVDGEFANLSLLSIGRLQKTKGEMSEALIVYEQIPQSSRYWSMAQVNIGNIQYQRKEYQDALATYQAVLDRDPDFCLATYNFGVVRGQQGDLVEAESKKREAANKCKDIRDKLALFDVGTSIVIDAEPDPVRRFYQAIGGESGPSPALWLTNPTVFMPIAIAMGILGLAMFHLRFRNTHLLARICEKCGRVFFQSDSPEGEWCSQCVNLYIRKDDLPSEAKIKKHEEVTQFNRKNRVITTVFQVVLPGSKRIMGGNAIGGMLTLVVWVLLVVFCISPVTQITYPFMMYVEGPALTTLINIGIALVYWTIFGLRPLWQED